MRGTDGMQETLFTMAKLNDFVPPDHPLRGVHWSTRHWEGATDCSTRCTLVMDGRRSRQPYQLWLQIQPGRCRASGRNRQPASDLVRTRDQGVAKPRLAISPKNTPPPSIASMPNS